MLFSGCGNNSEPQKSENMPNAEIDVTNNESVEITKPTTEIIELESWFLAVAYKVDYGFDEFIE